MKPGSDCLKSGVAAACLLTVALTKNGHVIHVHLLAIVGTLVVSACLTFVINRDDRLRLQP